MRAYVARRLLILPALLFGISIISFALLNFAPGDPAEIILRRQNPEEPPLPEAVRALRQQLGLDAPLPLRYGRWLFDVLKGDLGESYRSGTPIMSELVSGTIQLEMDKFFSRHFNICANCFRTFFYYSS